MKHITFIPSAVCVFIAALAPILISGEGKYIGKIGSIDTGKKEVIVNVDGGKTIKMGEQLYVRIGDEVVIMEATFPMQTTARCKLLKSSAGYFKDIERGMKVYKYDKAAIEDNDKKIETGDVEQTGNIDMVYIEGGTFTMGSPLHEEGRMNDESEHRVKLSPFWIGKYEVTQKQYEDIMKTNPSNFRGDNLPVEHVSWYDSVVFCNRLSEKSGLQPYYNIEKKRDPDNKSRYDEVRWTVTMTGGNGFRLPTDAEWEYACRAGTTTRFYWGDEVDGDYTWYKDNSDSKPHPVGQKKPNAWGLYDMSGNVWEWCWDWFGDYGSDATDPKGAASGGGRLERGGWYGDSYDLRSAYRGSLDPDFRRSNNGLRLARSVL